MYNIHDRKTLLETARASVHYGLSHGKPLPIEPDRYHDTLREKRACFVTLTIHGQLRGCIGTLIGINPLIEDVAHNAHAAAFRDPRFTPVTEQEAAKLHYHISVLSVPEPMTFKDEADLLAQIRPNVDGLIIEDDYHRGTFLPSVWESLPDKREFWRHLKQKAGLPSNHWSTTLKVSRYTAENIE